MARAHVETAERRAGRARPRPRRRRRGAGEGSRRSCERRAGRRLERRTRRAAVPGRGPALSRACAPARRCVDGGDRASARRRAARLGARRRRTVVGSACRVPHGGGRRRRRACCARVPAAAAAPEGAAPAPSRLPELDAVTVPMLVVQGARDRSACPRLRMLRTVVRVTRRPQPAHRSGGDRSCGTCVARGPQHLKPVLANLGEHAHGDDARRGFPAIPISLVLAGYLAVRMSPQRTPGSIRHSALGSGARSTA